MIYKFRKTFLLQKNDLSNYTIVHEVAIAVTPCSTNFTLIAEKRGCVFAGGLGTVFDKFIQSGKTKTDAEWVICLENIKALKGRGNMV